MNALAKLETLNSYRAINGKEPIAAWRQARHQPMLDAYEAEAAAIMSAAAADAGDADKMPIDHINQDFGNAQVAEIIKAEKIPGYKTFARYDKSSVDKPVAFIHQFLANHPNLTRKQAVAALIAYGINYSTARTQYQRWFSGRS